MVTSPFDVSQLRLSREVISVKRQHQANQSSLKQSSLTPLKGFTLIELMIVIAILGILAAMAIPVYQGQVLRSQVQRVVAESGQLRSAVEVCLMEGRTDIGAGQGQCNPGATGSQLMATPAGTSAATAALPADTGAPSVSDPLVLDTVISARFGNQALGQLTDSNGEVTWTRSPDGSWDCAIANIDPQYMPNGCN